MFASKKYKKQTCKSKKGKHLRNEEGNKPKLRATEDAGKQACNLQEWM